MQQIITYKLFKTLYNGDVFSQLRLDFHNATISKCLVETWLMALECDDDMYDKLADK